MDLELIFSGAGVLSMTGWLLLIASPMLPVWSDRIAGLIIPLVLSTGYSVLTLLFSADDGGYGSLADVVLLFSKPEILLVGWIHYLAFDLVIGAWMCRIARTEKISFYWVLPCLPLTFIFGPAGFLLFSIIRQTFKFRDAS